MVKGGKKKEGRAKASLREKLVSVYELCFAREGNTNTEAIDKWERKYWIGSAFL